MDNIKLGQPPQSDTRDAIHIAVMPVTAEEYLHPGDRVGVRANLASKSFLPHVGIVDPYLRFGVNYGERCWLLLFPNTITSLRHEWTLPSLDGPVAGRSLEEAEAVQWLTEFASKWNLTYNELIGDILSQGITANGLDIHSWIELPEGDEDKLWRYAEIVLMRKFDDQYRADTYFNCSC